MATISWTKHQAVVYFSVWMYEKPQGLYTALQFLIYTRWFRILDECVRSETVSLFYSNKTTNQDKDMLRGMMHEDTLSNALGSAESLMCNKNQLKSFLIDRI